LEAADLVVGCPCGLNNSRRTFFSVSLGCIKLGGGSASFGHATGPAVLQPDIANAQIAHKTVMGSFSISLVLFVLGCDFRHVFGVPLLCLACNLLSVGNLLGPCLLVLGQCSAVCCPAHAVSAPMREPQDGNHHNATDPSCVGDHAAALAAANLSAFRLAASNDTNCSPHWGHSSPSNP
jgi:hypothetical protein